MNSEIILFDFEYTAWEGSKARNWSEPWEHREIIQIAAIRITSGGKLAETACFDRLVKPTHNPLLSAYITELTGIQQSAVDLMGTCFPEAFAAFYMFSEQGRIPLFCYGDDVSVLLENWALNDMKPARFPAGIHDIRVLFEQAGIDTRQYTSGTVYQSVGAEFRYAAHNALNDVRSIAATIRQITHSGLIGSDWTQGSIQGRFLII